MYIDGSLAAPLDTHDLFIIRAPPRPPSQLYGGSSGTGRRQPVHDPPPPLLLPLHGRTIPVFLGPRKLAVLSPARTLCPRTIRSRAAHTQKTRRARALVLSLSLPLALYLYLSICGLDVNSTSGTFFSLSRLHGARSESVSALGVYTTAVCSPRRRGSPSCGTAHTRERAAREGLGRATTTSFRSLRSLGGSLVSRASTGTHRHLYNAATAAAAAAATSRSLAHTRTYGERASVLSLSLGENLSALALARPRVYVAAL